MSQQNTLYSVLGIEPSSSGEMIEAAFSARMTQAQEAGAETSLLRIAYDTLRTEESRAAYDRKLARQTVAQGDSITFTESHAGGRSYSLLFLLLLIVVGAVYWWRKPDAASPPPTPGARASLPTPSARGLGAFDGPGIPLKPVVAPREQTASSPVGQEAEQKPLTHATANAVSSVQPSCKPGFDPQCLAWSVFLIRQRQKSGSGVLIAPDRILTNCHVLAGGATNGLVVIHTQTQKTARVVQYTRLTDEDVCLLYAPGAGGTVIPWGNSENLNPGDTIYNFGHPGGSRDVIWSEANFVGRRPLNGETYLVTSNYCRPGSSGGPLLDQQGRLIGVVTRVQVHRSGNDGTLQYGACYSITEATARNLLSRTFFPIALAPAQF